jgi:WD40 repeat protein
VTGVKALCAAESRGRSVLLSGGDEGAVRVWDLGWRYTTAGDLTQIRGQRLVATGYAGNRPIALVAGAVPPRRYDVASGASWPIGEQRAVSAVALADGRAYCAYGPVVHSYSIDDSAAGPSFDGHTAPVVAIAAGRVGQRLLLATAAQDYRIRIWDARTGDSLSEALTEPGYWDKMTRALAFVSLPSGATLVAAGATGHLVTFAIDRLPGAPSSSELPARHHDYVEALAYDGRMLYSAGDDADLLGFDLSIGQLTNRWSHEHRGGVSALVCTEVSELPVLVSGGRDGHLRIWRRDLNLLATIPLDSPVHGLGAHAGVVVAGTDAGIVALDLTGLAKRASVAHGTSPGRTTTAT